MRITTVEFLRASRDAALVRLVGTWPGEGDSPPARLVVEAGGERQQFAALPAGPGGAPGGAWAAGFSVPAAFVESHGAAWRLELGDEVVELPRPRERGAAVSGRAERAALEREAALAAQHREAEQAAREREAALAAQLHEAERTAREREAELRAEFAEEHRLRLTAEERLAREQAGRAAAEERAAAAAAATGDLEARAAALDQAREWLEEELRRRPEEDTAGQDEEHRAERVLGF